MLLCERCVARVGFKKIVEFERTTMRKQVYKAVILTVGVVIILIAGCSGQDTSRTEVKRGRLTAAENKQLKKQLEQLGKELEKQKELFAKCLQEQKDSEEQLQKSSPDNRGTQSSGKAA